MKFDKYELFASSQVVYIGKAKNSLGKRISYNILTPIDSKAFRHKIWKASLSSFVFTDHISHKN